VNEILTKLEAMKLSNEGGGALTTNFKLAKHLLTEDRLKTLRYEFEYTENSQRPRQFYIKKIIELFQTCKDPGG